MFFLKCLLSYFNTDPDKELMSANGNTYIVPMISNRKDYASVIEILKFDKRRYFVFNKDSYASMIYYAEYVAGDDSCRRIAFQDTLLRLISTRNK